MGKQAIPAQMPPESEIEHKADFSIVRYAQVWEDADVLLQGLDIQPDDICLSIASAGDNALAMLARNPARVIALDLNPAQLFCLELRVAAYQTLTHPQLLELMGSRPCDNRFALYQIARKALTKGARGFWDGKHSEIDQYGIGGVGKFERYFRLFARCILPLVHSKADVSQLLSEKSAQERQRYFDRHWNTWRWRALIRVFFSQTVMGKMGRDPAFFTYVNGDFAEHVSRKIEYGMCALNPAENPYLHWILRATHGEVLPFALRAENFFTIRENLGKLEWHLQSTEAFVARARSDGLRMDKYNLSNIFEYMSEENYLSALQALLKISAPKARLLYWNMMVARRCPASLREKLRPLTTLAERLHAKDKAIFYSHLAIEEVL